MRFRREKKRSPWPRRGRRCRFAGRPRTSTARPPQGVDVDTGQLLWKAQLAAELGAATLHWGFTTSPLVTGDVVVVLTGGAPDRAVTAFDRRTGAVVWRRGSDAASYQSPMLAAIDNVERVVVGGDRFLMALDPRDGREVWRYEHGGRGFFGQIINPVAVEWTTRELKLNYATPIAHDGKVFGYSGAFLSCVDARTGALVWRSRPPGDGFPILVDGHLVVMTKQGTLAVSAASADGFSAKASLDLFPRLVWTPPSFAEGRIFARDSYAEVAAVDVVPLSRTTDAAPAAAVPGVVPGSRFARWVADVERAPNPVEMLQQFLAGQKTFPIVEDLRGLGPVRSATWNGSSRCCGLQPAAAGAAARARPSGGGPRVARRIRRAVLERAGHPRAAHAAAGGGLIVRPLLFSLMLGAAATAGAPQSVPIESGRNLTPFGVKVEPAEYRGRTALRVVEPQVNAGGGIAVLEGAAFHNGAIEAYIAGLPAPGAPGDARGFVGIAFRVQRNPQRYEAFYLRPTNGRADDQLRRNHSTQYVSEPDFPWHRLRKEHPGVYESYVDLEPGAWTRVRVVVNGRKAELFVHDAPQPALIVNDLKLGDVSGGIGLFIGLGTEAYFTSLNVTPR